MTNKYNTCCLLNPDRRNAISPTKILSHGIGTVAGHLDLDVLHKLYNRSDNTPYPFLYVPCPSLSFFTLLPNDVSNNTNLQKCLIELTKCLNCRTTDPWVE